MTVLREIEGIGYQLCAVVRHATRRDEPCPALCLLSAQNVKWWPSQLLRWIGQWMHSSERTVGHARGRRSD